jgi:DNA-directed RNA polymerase specialized sigma24 family protein
VERDGLSPAEASSRLQVDRHVEQSALAVSMANRRAPRRFVPLEECPPARMATHRGQADDMEQRDACRRVRRALMRAMRQLTKDERRWLRLRFYEGMRIAEIAQRDRRRPMECYREFSRMLARLQSHLVAAGVDSGLVAVALDR